MTIPQSEELFVSHIQRSGIVSSEQLDAARTEQARLAAAGEALGLAEVLVRQGLLTHAILANVESNIQTVQKPGPQNIGQFKLVRKLGEGGMGSVFLADDTVAERPVALKILPKKFAANPEFLGRFKREAKSAGRLNHENVVAAYTTGEEKGLHFYIMEYCDGETLDKLLKRNGRMAWDKAVGCALQVARGLKHAHEMGIIHRDIKPSNIIITTAGTAKILDMGLSKNIADSEQSFNTVTGTALGTPHYISPEQAKGEREIDGRTDIYSLGATLYQLVTGATPFQGATPAVIMMKHLNDRLPNPRDIGEDIPEGVVRVIRKMMAKEPGDRYRDCGEVIQDFELVLQGRSPVNADVDDDKTSVMTQAMPSKIRDEEKRKQPLPATVPPARIQPPAAQPRSPAVRSGSRAAWFAAAGGVVALICVLALFANFGKTPSKDKNVAQIASTLALSTPAANAGTSAQKAAADAKTVAAAAPGAKETALPILLVHEDFEHVNLSNPPENWDVVAPEKMSIVKNPGRGNALRIGVTEKYPQSVNLPQLIIPLDIEKIRGRTIRCSAFANSPKGFTPFAASAAARPSIILFVSAPGASSSLNASLQPGEHGWKQLAVTHRIPHDATKAFFVLHFSQCTGEVLFDDLKVEIVPDNAAANAPAPADGKSPNPDEPSARKRNAFAPLDISAVCNADVISTDKHPAADSFKADLVTSWTTTSWLRANDKKEAGIPDNGQIKIPKVSPHGFFQLQIAPLKNAIMFTPPKGRQPNPVEYQIPAAQRGRFSQLAFLHGGSLGDGQIRVVFHYASGPNETAVLRINDWHPLYRLPLAERETVAVSTLTTRLKPAEMCSQIVPVNAARVLESMTMSFDPASASAEEVPHDDRFTACIFAISAQLAPDSAEK